MTRFHPVYPGKACSHGRSNQENCHSLNDFIGKFPNLVVSRRDRSEERHFSHPGRTTDHGVELEMAQKMAAEGVRYTPLLLNTALHMFYMI